ncbi:phage tail protein [Anaeromyxobacter dehalogenans]|uniref:phage tail protein n=1 Tax=Anaeromyxobacter dehalogenans TaxID=161493 RepID=UPI00059B7966|nr:phage tail protein [Anaeromyxobacter dehalogenans]
MPTLYSGNYRGQTLAMVWAICEAPVVGVSHAYRDGDYAQLFHLVAEEGWYEVITGSVAPTCSFAPYASGPGQTFVGTVQFRSNMFGTPEGKIPNVEFVVIGALSHPADVLVDILLSGSSLTAVQIETGSYRAYCDAMGFTRVDRGIDDATTAADLVDELLRDTDSTIVWSNGRLRVIPNGTFATGSYVPPTSSVSIDQDELLWIDGEDPVTVVRVPDDEVFNEYPISIQNGDANGSTDTYSLPDAGHQAIHGQLRAPTVTSGWIKRPAHALTLSGLMAQRSITRRNRYRFRLGPRWAALEPGDLVGLSEPTFGLVDRTVRITSIEEDEDGSLKFEAMEWPHVAAVDVTPQPHDGFDDGLVRLYAPLVVENVSVTASAALSTGTVALGSASVAHASASQAFTTASWALATGTVALSSATVAFNTASIALTSASRAQATASNALATGSAALTSASLAFTTASWALGTGTVALNSASQAHATASQAFTSASAALSGLAGKVSTDLGNLPPGTITGIHVASGTLSGTHVAAATIQGTHISGSTITGENIVAGTISGTHVAFSTLTGQHVQAASISGSDIAAATISGSNIAAGTILGTHISGATITGGHIQAGTISGTHIAAATISGTDIAAGTISGSHVAVGTLTGDHIRAGTVSGTEIAAGTLTASHLAANIIRTSNYLEATGTLYPAGTTGAYAKSGSMIFNNSSTPMRIAAGGAYVGQWLLDEVAVRSVNAIDFDPTKAASFYRGESRAAPVIYDATNGDRLTVYQRGGLWDGTVLHNQATWDFVLQPKSGSDGFDGLRYLEVTVYNSAPNNMGTVYVPIPDRKYQNATLTSADNAIRVTYTFHKHTDGNQYVYSAAPNNWNGYLRVKLHNVYGYSPTRDFQSTNTAGGAMTAGLYSLGGSTGSGGGGDSSGDPIGCPVPETPVRLWDGRLKPAGQVEVGDLLWSFSEERGAYDAFPVVFTGRGELDLYRLDTEDGRSLRVSVGHRFMTPSGWRLVQDLKPGERVLGQPDGVVADVGPDGRGETCRITVRDAHTYLTEGLLSHNATKL